MSTDSKIMAEKLMNDLLGFAEKMLVEYGEFHPFGGYCDNLGEIVQVGVKPSSGASAQDRADTLISSFKELARRGKGLVFGIATNVTLPASGGAEDAVQIFLEHEAGYCAEVFFCYVISDSEVQITNTIAQQGKPIFFVQESKKPAH